MRFNILDLLRCVICYKRLELEPIIIRDECIEGILYCSCGASYPIVDSIPILIPNLIEYFTARRKILGYLLVNSSEKMKEYLKPIARALSKEVYYDRYEQNALNLYRYIDNAFYDRIAEIIINNLDNNYLEIGCGFGIVANKVAEYMDIAIGVDRSFSMIKRAKRDNKAEFLVADLLSLPFKGFDIVSINTLDLFNPELFIKAVKKSIKNTLILADPYDFRDEHGDPIDRYNGRIIRSILEREGFEIKNKEEEYIPWRVRINERAYMLYLVDLIITHYNS